MQTRLDSSGAQTARSRRVLGILALIIILILAACGSNDDNSDESAAPTQPATPEARALLTEATTQLQAAQSFGLIMDVDGYPVYIQADGLGLTDDMQLQFNYAEGSFQAPDRMQANIEIALGAVGTTIELIAIDRDHYLSGDVLTGGQWLQAELIPGFSPAALVAEDTGIANALNTISNLAYVDDTTLDGIDVDHVRGDVAASAVNSLTFGLIRSADGVLGIDVYIRQDNRQIERVVLTEPAPDASETATIWTITFLDFNNDSIAIDAPTL